MRWKIFTANIIRFVKKALDGISSALSTPDTLKRLANSAPPEALFLSCHASLPNPNSQVRALFNYRDPLVQRLIFYIKDKHQVELASSIGILLADEAISAIAEISEIGRGNNNAVILCPVPISKPRRRARGYSQTEFLCEAILASSIGKDFEYHSKLLTRTKFAQPQTSLTNRASRLKNLRGKFSADIVCIGRTVVVIDDVSTTGATLIECRRALLASGASEVILISVAKAE